ncbi:MAG: hypothetical protein V4628_01820 [Pseudomonadota bacterium]
MTELQLAAVIMLLAGALPVLVLAEFIQRCKKYSLLAGRNLTRITDQDAWAITICNGLRGFATVVSVGCVLTFSGLLNKYLFVVSISVMPLMPLALSIINATRKYMR